MTIHTGHTPERFKRSECNVSFWFFFSAQPLLKVFIFCLEEKPAIYAKQTNFKSLFYVYYPITPHLPLADRWNINTRHGTAQHQFLPLRQNFKHVKFVYDIDSAFFKRIVSISYRIYLLKIWKRKRKTDNNNYIHCSKHTNAYTRSQRWQNERNRSFE